MTPETLAALKGSIEKWEKIVAGTGEDKGASNCPLCQMFAKDRFVDECRGCPVMERTGHPGCDGTPYFDHDNDDPESGRAELEFLRSLLPRWEWGFDTTKFTLNGFGEVMRIHRFRSVGRVITHLGEWHWRSIDATGEFDGRFSIWTTGNPNTGEYYRRSQRPDELGFAGSIGIEGDPGEVRVLVDTIRHHTESIKDESPHKRSFI